jgi:hypothetical protein
VRKEQATVLLVDSDLSFVFWLGQALDLAGCEALPARSTAAASELIREHRLSVDTLVIDPVLPDALSFVAGLRESRPQLKAVAALPGLPSDPTDLPGFNAIRRKPEHYTSEAQAEWIGLIQGLEPSRSHTGNHSL